MVSVAEVAAAIRAALATLRDAGHAVAAAGDNLGSARSTMAAVVEGSGRAEVTELTAALATAADHLAAAQSVMVSAVDAVDGYLTDIGAAGTTHESYPLRPPEDRAAGTSSHDSPSLVHSVSQPHDPPPPFRRHWGVEVPARPTGGQTGGVLTDCDGRRLHDDVLWSGATSSVDTTTGVRNRRVARSFSNLHHVECRVAALMRSGRLASDVVLYLNNTPCRARTPQERNCHELLPGLLPAGHRITVFTVGADAELVASNVYTGTGEELV